MTGPSEKRAAGDSADGRAPQSVAGAADVGQARRWRAASACFFRACFFRACFLGPCAGRDRFGAPVVIGEVAGGSLAGKDASIESSIFSSSVLNFADAAACLAGGLFGFILRSRWLLERSSRGVVFVGAQCEAPRAEAIATPPPPFCSVGEVPLRLRRSAILARRAAGRGRGKGGRIAGRERFSPGLVDFFIDAPRLRPGRLAGLFGFCCYSFHHMPAYGQRGSLMASSARPARRRALPRQQAWRRWPAATARCARFWRRREAV
jgi:hypothetical protein